MLLTPGTSSLKSSYDYSNILPVTFYWHQGHQVLSQVIIAQIFYQSRFTDTRANLSHVKLSFLKYFTSHILRTPGQTSLKSSYDYSNIIPVTFDSHFLINLCRMVKFPQPERLPRCALYLRRVPAQIPEITGQWASRRWYQSFLKLSLGMPYMIILSRMTCYPRTSLGSARGDHVFPNNLWQ